MERDLHHNLNDVMALNLSAIASNTTTVGSIIDTQGYESIEFLIWSATLTDGTYTAKIEDGDDPALADAADVATALVLDALPAFVATDDNAVKRVGVISKKRYVRLSLVSTGVTVGGTLGAVAVQGHPMRAPVAV